MKQKSKLSKADKDLLRKFKITQNVQIRLLKAEARSTIQRPNKSVEKTFHCSKCSFKSNSFKGLRDHRKLHQIEKHYKCHLCPFSTVHSSNIKPHLLTHTNQKPFPCQLCKYKGRTKSNLNAHLLVHTTTGEKLFPCDFCTKHFRTRGNKSRHELICKMNPNHKDEDWVKLNKRYNCPFCDYSGFTQHYLDNHLLVHEEKKAFPCPLCNKSFRVRSALRLHTITHTGERHCKCQYCPKEFVLNANRKLHEDVCKLNPNYKDESWIEAQKTFKCSLCNYAGRHKSYLKTHMRTHTGDKPYKCTLCNFQSVSSSNLSTHIASHTGEKALKCSHCNFTAASHATIRNHSKSFHSENDPRTTFLCPVCSKTFHSKIAIFVKTHLAAHTCNLCKKVLTRLGERLRHQRICKGVEKVNKT